MATKQEGERLAVVENEVQNVKTTVQEVRDDVKAIRSLVEDMDGTYVKVSTARWVVGTFILALTAIATIVLVVKK